MIRLRAEAPSTSHPPPLGTPPSGTPPLLPIPAPTSSPFLLLPSTDHRAVRPEVCLPPWKRLCIALGPRYEVGESSSAPTARPTRGFRADYGFVATLDKEIRRDPKRDDTDEIYGRLDDAQDDRLLMSSQFNILYRDRHAHAYTTLLMEREVRLSREAWVQSMDASDTARSEAQLNCGDTETNEYTADTGDSIAETLKAMIDQGVTDALAAHDADRNTNGDDSHNSGTGVRRMERVARETVGHDVAYAMTWVELKKNMTNKYCPRGEMKNVDPTSMDLEFLSLCKV
ncbi:hypothetical protein Tco_0863344 [Tanacetum coccineum]